MALTSPSFPSASLLLEVLEQSEETVAIVNPEGLAIHANRALTELLGLAGDEIPEACSRRQPSPAASSAPIRCRSAAAAPGSIRKGRRPWISCWRGFGWAGQTCPEQRERGAARRDHATGPQRNPADRGQPRGCPAGSGNASGKRRRLAPAGSVLQLRRRGGRTGTATGADLALLDLGLPDNRGVDGIVILAERFPALPVVVLTGSDDHDLGFSAVGAGAQDFLSKDQVTASVLLRSINYAIERQRLKSELQRATGNLQRSENRLRQLIEENSDGMLIVNTAGLVRFINPAAEALLDRRREEILDQPFGYSLDSGAPAEFTIAHRSGREVICELRRVPTDWHGEQVVSRLPARHHRTPAAGKPAALRPEDGGARQPDPRHRPRFQQRPRRDHRLWQRPGDEDRRPAGAAGTDPANPRRRRPRLHPDPVPPLLRPQPARKDAPIRPC